jgi:hypothetical protein
VICVNSDFENVIYIYLQEAVWSESRSHFFTGFSCSYHVNIQQLQENRNYIGLLKVLYVTAVVVVAAVCLSSFSSLCDL